MTSGTRISATALLGYVDKKVWNRQLNPVVGKRMRGACLDVLVHSYGTKWSSQAIGPHEARQAAGAYEAAGGTPAHTERARLFLRTFTETAAELRSAVARPPIVPIGDDLVRATEAAFTSGEIASWQRSRVQRALGLVMPQVAGRFWMEMPVVGRDIADHIDSLEKPDQYKSELRVSIRLAIRLLDNRSPVAASAMVPDKRRAPVRQGEPPTGEGLLSHTARLARGGALTKERAHNRRYAVRNTLALLFPNDALGHSLVDVDIEALLAGRHSNTDAKLRHLSEFYAALRDYEADHPGVLGKTATQARRHGARVYTDDFRPTPRGLVNLIEDAKRRDDLTPIQALGLKTAVKFVCRSAFGDGWEMVDLRRADVVAAVEGAPYSTTSRKTYPSAFRRAFAVYEQRFPGVLPTLPDRFSVSPKRTGSVAERGEGPAPALS